MDQPPSWCCPALHHLQALCIKGLEEVQCMLPEPGGKRVLRCAQVLERALEIMPLQVKDRQIPLRRVLEIQAIDRETPAAAESQVLVAARSPKLPAPVPPLLRLAWFHGEGKSHDSMLFISLSLLLPDPLAL